MASNPFQDMLRAIGAVYAAEPDPEGPRAAQTLLRAAASMVFAPCPPCRFDAPIRALLALGDHPAAGPILRAQDLLPWGSNPVEGNTEDRIAAMISVATLMGPQGPILAPDIRLGLVYMQPHSYYPLHLHDADETYAIVAGQALWTAGDDRRMRGAGDMIHHPSLMPHAFRTGTEGFVALWRWSGDINTHSYSFIEDPQIGVPA